LQQKIKQEKARLTVSSLKQMATSKKLQDILKYYIEYEKIPIVRDAWIEYFLDIKNKK